MPDTNAPNLVTLDDVARTAGVSTSTVSRALHKNPRISPQTRKRVIQAVRKVGYNAQAIERKVKANNAKQRLANKQIEILLCPLTEQKNILALYYFSNMVEGLQNNLNDAGLTRQNVCIWNPVASHDYPQNKQILTRLARADGVLVLGNPSDELLERMARFDTACVLVDGGREYQHFNTVTLDYVMGGMIAAGYLMDHGHQHIGYLEGTHTVRSWVQGKIGVISQIGLASGNNHFECRRSINSDLSEIGKAFDAWLDSENCPTAFIFPYPESLLEVELVLARRGLKCPDDVSVINFGTPEINLAHLDPTYLDTDSTEMERRAIQRLVQLLTQPEKAEHAYHIVIPMPLVEGRSVRDLNQQKEVPHAK